MINTDDPYGRRLAQELNGRVRVLTFGLETPADYTATDIQETLDGTAFKISGCACKIRLLGRHNVYNALAAFAACVSQGIDETTALEGLAALPGVPGRMEQICAGQDFYVFVDFAYTDESLRREDPRQIFDDILQGMQGCTNYTLQPDRAQAIRSALETARPQDIVIIAGKGHEDYQIIGTEKRHFSDQETARAWLKEKYVSQK